MLRGNAVLWLWMQPAVLLLAAGLQLPDEVRLTAVPALHSCTPVLPWTENWRGAGVPSRDVLCWPNRCWVRWDCQHWDLTFKSLPLILGGAWFPCRMSLIQVIPYQCWNLHISEMCYCCSSSIHCFHLSAWNTWMPGTQYSVNSWRCVQDWREKYK